MPDGKAPHFPQQPVARQNEDGSLELECFLEANPLPDIKWFYDQRELKQEGRFGMRLDKKGNEAFSAVLQIKVSAALEEGGTRRETLNEICRIWPTATPARTDARSSTLTARATPTST